MNAAVHHGSLQAAVVDDLGSRIATGELAAGTILNPEALTSQYGVSRTVLREALRTLETLGMTSARPRVGTIVRPMAAWDLLDTRVISWRSAGPQAAEQLADLFLLRQAVEPMIAGLAARHADDDQLEQLAEWARQLDAAYAARDTAGFAAADEGFHTLLVAAAGSPVLRQLARTLQATLQSRFRSPLPVFGGSGDESLARHLELAAAIARRDPGAAEAISADLVRETRTDLLTWS